MIPNCNCDACVDSRDWFRDNKTEAEYHWMLNILPNEAYRMGWIEPHYPMPTMIGEVYFYPTDIVITDCDESFDPRLWLLLWRDEIHADYPHDSPNYR